MQYFIGFMAFYSDTNLLYMSVIITGLQLAAHPLYLKSFNKLLVISCS